MTRILQPLPGSKIVSVTFEANGRIATIRPNRTEGKQVKMYPPGRRERLLVMCHCLGFKRRTVGEGGGQLVIYRSWL